MRRREIQFPKLDVSDPKKLETDLSDITRASESCQTIVRLMLPWDDAAGKRPSIEWLKFGQAQLRLQKESSFDGCFRLEAYLTSGVTDFEHDSGYALRLPLIGLQLASLPVMYHYVNFMAWVDPNQEEGYEDFHVPRPGYNPMTHPKAITCKECCDEHIMVPEGFYVPPFDSELYNFVRGKQVEISIGPRRK